MTKLISKKQEIKNRIDLINKGEVPEGYKKRFGYIVPNDWDIVPIKKVVTQVRRSVDKPNEPYYRLSVRSHAKGTFHSFVENPEQVAMEELFEVKENDLIVNITFAWEHAIAIVKKEDEGLLVSHRFPTYEFNKNACVKFYENIIKFPRIKKMLGDMSPGGAGRNRVLNQTDFYNKLYVPYASRKEQEKIAEILSCCDKLIELKSELIQKKKKINISTINKVFNNIFYKKNLVKLSNLCSDFIVPMRDKPKTFDGSIPWCRIEDVEGNFLNGTKSNKYVSEDTVKKMNLKIIPSGSVICACSASIGTYVINTTPLITNQTFIGLVCSEKIYNKYLLYFLKTQTNNLMRKSNGTTIGYISREQFERMDIPYVPMQEQMHIANVFFQADKEIELLEQELEQYKQLKKSLSQLLLTGIVRVNEV